MRLASAQIMTQRGDVPSNLLDHYRMIENAFHYGADLIVFPEMSITGYERENAYLYLFTEEDARLDKLRQLSVDKNMIVVAGAPIQIKDELFIGSFIILPDSSILIYTKQYLHFGEEFYFKSTLTFNPIIEVQDERISFAICADIDHLNHVESAHGNKSSIYIASIFYSPNGIPSAHNALSQYAKEYNLKILMSNFAGLSWGQESGGQSAFWDNHGKLISALDNNHSGLLVTENNKEGWTGKTIIDA